MLDIDFKKLKLFFSTPEIIEEFIDIIFQGKEDYKRTGELNTLKYEWLRLINCWREATTALHRKTNITCDEDAWQIQDILDEFCHQFVLLFGSDAITNYIWILMSGVLVFYFIKYKNISSIQNQV